MHASNLARFAFVYKGSMLVLRNVGPAGAGKEGRYDSFLAGLLGGYTVFGRSKTSLSQQVLLFGYILDERYGAGQEEELTVTRLSSTSLRVWYLLLPSSLSSLACTRYPTLSAPMLVPRLPTTHGRYLQV